MTSGKETLSRKGDLESTCEGDRGGRTLPTPGGLYRRYRPEAKKWLGQHFLTNPLILQRIKDEAKLGEGSQVLEIGPGCGTLTTTLMRGVKRVVAVEMDRDAVLFLKEELVPYGLQLEHADVLGLDIEVLLGGSGEKRSRDDGSNGNWVCVSNLPYNASVPIILKLLGHPEVLCRLVVMVQKEVAERLCARHGSKAYGSLSYAVQMRAEVSKCFELGPGAFSPPPKVQSAVVLLTLKRKPHERLEAIEKVVKSAFLHRRKTLRNALTSYAKEQELSKEAVERAFEVEGIVPDRRPQDLDLEEWTRFALALLKESELRQRTPETP